MTLIELIVVMAIMGLVLSVSVAAIHVTTSAGAGTETALQELLAEARLLAAREQTVVTVEIGAQGRYALYRPDGELGGQGTLPVDAVWPEPFRLRVYPAGTAAGGTLRLRQRGEWQGFVIDRVTARATPTP